MNRVAVGTNRSSAYLTPVILESPRFVFRNCAPLDGRFEGRVDIIYLESDVSDSISMTIEEGGGWVI